jgi:hypothetical protein
VAAGPEKSKKKDPLFSPDFLCYFGAVVDEDMQPLRVPGLIMSVGELTTVPDNSRFGTESSANTPGRRATQLVDVESAKNWRWHCSRGTKQTPDPRRCPLAAR